MKLLIATYNQGKLKDYKNLLKDYPLEIVSLDDEKITDDIEENGQTFEENSLLKARFFCKLANMPTLADDGGLVIDVLNGEPGVHSRRWKGYRMTDQEMVDYALERMQGIQREQRTARMVAVLSLVFPDGREFQSKAAIEGIISEKQETAIMQGYPFRSIFFVKELGKIFTDLTEEEHDRINHRIPAIKELSKHFME
ncbi:MAG: non-canonical purine NTP pyrophosphatase [Parcubacteria group bacterium]